MEEEEEGTDLRAQEDRMPVKTERKAFPTGAGRGQCKQRIKQKTIDDLR